MRVINPEVLYLKNPGGFHFLQLFLNVLIVLFYGSLELASWLAGRFAMTTERRD